MTLDRESLVSEAARALTDLVPDPKETASHILDSFAGFTPARIKATIDTNLDFLILGNPLAGGVSIKPGNVVLNWRKLFRHIPEIVLTGAGATQTWLIPFAALYIWNLVWALRSIPLSPDHAIAMYAMWHAHGDTQRATEDDALESVNRYLSEVHRKPMAPAVFVKVIDDLVALDCVELNGGIIWLREWVRKNT